jgi:hypothetical protein
MYKFIPIAVIAFILTGALLCSCDSKITDNPCDTCAHSSPPTWDQLHDTKFAIVLFNGAHYYRESFYLTYVDNNILSKWNFITASTWNENSFTSSLLKCTFNSSGSVIDSFRFYKDDEVYKQPRFFAYLLYSLNGVSIPFVKFQGDTAVYSVSGPAVKEHLTKISLFGKELGTNIYQEELYDSTEWRNTLNPPEIILKFCK